jgi:hypothetical protein
MVMLWELGPPVPLSTTQRRATILTTIREKEAYKFNRACDTLSQCLDKELYSALLFP